MGTTGPPARLGANFHRFWAAGTLTNLGDGVLSAVLPLVAATLTHDPLAVSGLLAARFLPWLLIAPFTGVLIDRVDRLRAMAVANTVCAVAVAVLALVVAAGQVTMAAMYAVLFTVTCCETVSDPASRIAVTGLVPARSLDRANGRLEGGRLVAQDCVAKPVGGMLFAVAAVLPLAGAAVSYALCAVLVALVVVALRRTGAPGASRGDAPGAESGARRSLREGFAFVLGDRMIREMALTNAVMMIGLQMGTAVLVLHLREEWGLGPELYGLFLATIAVGGVLGAVSAERLIALLGRAAVMYGGYAGIGAALVLMAVLPNAWLGAVAWTLLGLAMTASNTAGSLMMQIVVPDRLRGRVGAAFRTLGWGLAPVGALTGGFLGRLDLALPYLAGGLAILTAVFAFRWAIGACARTCDEAASALAATADR